MPLVPGTRLGPYEILAPLGAGGMGEVYRGKDTRLDRTVAIKVLPKSGFEDTERRQRFEREARAVSSLNHPHICVLHDVGRQDDLDFLVMEYLEGETLLSRIAKGPLPLEQGLRYAVEIAEALALAHRRGVHHRDLKPANIMLTRSGAKLLDFGLAKLGGPLVAPDVLAASALLTVQQPITETGTILGTVQYMAPEQLEGKDTDARTDIFAFGLVLYEMLTGRKAFEGKSQAGLIAAILHTDPPLASSLQPMTPPALDRVVRKCLAKDPEERWQTAQDLAGELKWIAEGGGATAETVPSKAPRAFPWMAVAAAAGVVALVLAILLALSSSRIATPAAQVVRSSLLPPNLPFVPRDFVISPDGTRLAFVAEGQGGKNALWVRALSAPGAQALAGAEGAVHPFWAPDSRRVGFFADGKLKTVEISGGAVRILCDALAPVGGAWSRDDTILFAPVPSGPLYRIPASGGAPTAATRIAAQSPGQAHRWPAFLPDGRHFLFFVDWSSPADPQGDGIYVASLDSMEARRLSPLKGNVAFASGHLLYVSDRNLMAQPFDPVRLETTGPAAPVIEQELEKEAAFSRAGFSVSENGLLVFESAADTASRLAWFGPDGKELGQLPETGYRDPSLSPDGRFLAVSSDDERNGKHFIRIHDFARGVSTRITETGSDEFPTWSRDGRFITYLTGAGSGNTISINRVAADGSGPPQVLVKAGMVIPNHWSPDGRLVFMTFGKGPVHFSVFFERDRSIVEVPGAGGAEAQFSPDGKWLAFQSPSAKGAGGIFVQPSPGPGGRIQISNAGGSQPRWSRDGTRLFYIAPDKKLMEARFDPLTGPAGTPRALFQTRIVASNYVLFQYDVARDGRFLINSFPSNYASPLTLLTGWTSLLRPTTESRPSGSGLQ